MVEPVARVRPFQQSDDKQVKFNIGKANYGQLASANVHMYTNPLIIALWIGLASAMATYMHWWPTVLVPSTLRHVLQWTSPLRAFAATAVPMMFVIDWLNRPHFERFAKDVLSRPDLISLGQYYARSPASSMWIIERGEIFMGFIALDASLEAESEQTVSSETTQKYKKGTSPTAVIRHFYVDEEYRPTGIQEDLLKEALDHAFKDPKVMRVKAYDSNLVKYIQRCLREAGFKQQKYTRTIGLGRWRIAEQVLDRITWEAKHKKTQ